MPQYGFSAQMDKCTCNADEFIGGFITFLLSLQHKTQGKITELEYNS